MTIVATEQPSNPKATSVMFEEASIGKGLDYPKIDLKSNETLIFKPLFTPGAQQSILAVVNWEEPPPAVVNPSPGRTLNLPLLNGGKSDRHRVVKTKGAVLLCAAEPEIVEAVRNDKELRDRHVKGSLEYWSIKRPDPNQIYQGPGSHFTLDENLRISFTEGRPKTLGTLAFEAARAEYKCHYALQKHDLSTKPVLAAPYANSDGTPLKDINGYRLGVSVTEFQPSMVTADNFFDFHLTDGGIYTTSSRFNSITKIDVMSLVKDETMKIFQRMATAKRKAILEANLSRHAGHVGNFLVNEQNPTSGKIYLSDLDSCIILPEDLSPRQKGSNAVRDIARDLWRTAYTMTYQCMSKEFFQNFADLKPFTMLLRNYFGEQTSHPINELISGPQGLGSFLDASYLTVANKNLPSLKVIGEETKRYVTQGNAGDNYTYLLGYCGELHIEFLKCALYACALLVEASPSFKRAGYIVTVPSDETGFLNELNRGIREHCVRTHAFSGYSLENGEQVPYFYVRLEDQGSP